MSAAYNVIMIYGFLDAGAIWRPLKTCLGAEAEGWLTPDLAGMSKLFGDDGHHTLKRYTTDLLAKVSPKAAFPVTRHAFQ